MRYPATFVYGRERQALPRASVVNVTQLRTVDRERLTERVGQLPPARIREVLGGLALVFGLDALEG